MENKKIKVGFVSLGCSKNLTDTETMLARLNKDGFEITPDETEADVVVINTCGFIESAKRESIDSILDIAWLKKHGKLKAIVVTGCLAERYREQITEEFPEVDAVLGVGSCGKITDAVEAAVKGKKFTDFGDKNASPLGGDRILTTPEYTAYLKIAEGCDNRCTYCAIPLIRGKFRSRPMDDIVKEAKELETLGVKELNLIAQDTTRYGLDLYGRYALAGLVKRISAETEGIRWIRLLYCYPDKITDELIDEIKNDPKVVKYIDIPIQHISDGVLKRMNRHGDSSLIKDTVKRLKAAVPDIILRTTVMVGFPGESERDFEELCGFIKETKFERLGAFTFSCEEGTPAAEMEDDVPAQVKQDRYDAVMSLQMNITEARNQAQIGRTVTVLCEDYDVAAETYYGRSAADAPDIDTKIYFSAKTKKRIRPGTFVEVKITGAVDYDLVGEAIINA
ncbi:MAG: 30S ribosomal protein S12 methylthiotransferase RimO [Clostridia bacterium]|nr:30S ribosomal protein S12 methylthiotransferase RimO [Clostridia bacterium]